MTNHRWFVGTLFVLFILFLFFWVAFFPSSLQESWNRFMLLLQNILYATLAAGVIVGIWRWILFPKGKKNPH